MAFLEDKERQILLDRYFDIEWCDDVSDLRCVHCHRVAINNYVSSCQHIFCKICSKFYNDEEKQLKCPRCHEFITKTTNKDFNVDVKIHQLKILCPNKKYGCNYADHLWKIPSHLFNCTDKREAALPVQSPVISTMDDVHKMIENAVKEKFDQLDSKVNALTQTMTSLEKKVEDTKVGIELAAEKYAEELQAIKSQLESVNQTKKNKLLVLHRKKMKKISSNVEHVMHKITSITREVDSLKNKRSEELSIWKAKTFEWIITDVEKNKQTDNWIIESHLFTFVGYKYEIKAKMEKKAGIIAIYLQFNDGSAVNRDLNNSGFTKCKYVIKDQSNALQRKDIIYETDLWFYNCYAPNKWVFGQGVANTILYPAYTKNDCMKIVISLEPPSIDRSFISNNGILLWRVEKYNIKIQEHFYEDILSDSFYTSPQGYRVKTRLLMNDKGPMLVEVNFLTGEHDHLLFINFPHKTTVTLINQLNPSINVAKIQQRKDVQLYEIELVSRRFIERNGFIKDDCLLLKVVIEPV